MRTLNLLLLIVLWPAVGPLAASSSLRVTTWNLAVDAPDSFLGPFSLSGETRLRDVASVLRDLDPDVVLLQSVPDEATCDRLAGILRPEGFRVLVCSSFTGDSAPAGQVAILSKLPAFGAWAEAWKPEASLEPPGGFAFGAVRMGSVDVCFYSVQLKDNQIGARNPNRDARSNILQRELSARQLLRHVSAVEAKIAKPSVAFVLGGDFNTTEDSGALAIENTLRSIADSGFHNALAGLPPAARVTRPPSAGQPGATLDYLFGRHVQFTGAPIIVPTHAVARFPITSTLRLSPEPFAISAVSGPPPARPPQSLFPLSFDNAWLRWVPPLLVILVVLVCWRLITSRPFRYLKPLDLRPIAPSSASEPELPVPANPFSSTGFRHDHAWRHRADVAERRADQASAMMRAGLLPHLARAMKDKLLWALMSQRRYLLQTQEFGAETVEELEERLAAVQSHFQGRIVEYEKKIAGLERELATKDEINRELLRTRVQTARQTLESVKSMTATLTSS